MLIENQGQIVEGESPVATAKRWAAELAAAQGRKLEPKAEAKAEAEPEAWEPGELETKSRKWAAELVAARRLSRLNSFTGTHKLPVYRA